MYKLLIALMLLLPMNSVQLRVDAPYRVSPGSNVTVKIIIRNLGRREVVVDEIRAKVYSERVFCLPLRASLGYYILPLEKVRVPPGEERVIKKVIEVPYLPLAGDFTAEIKAYGKGELGSCSVKFVLDYTPLSLLAVSISLAVLLGILLVIYRKLIKVRSELREKREITLSVVTA